MGRSIVLLLGGDEFRRVKAVPHQADENENRLREPESKQGYRAACGVCAQPPGQDAGGDEKAERITMFMVDSCRFQRTYVGRYSHSTLDLQPGQRMTICSW